MNSRNKPDEKLREELFECRRRIAELEKSESRYRDLVEKAGIAILIEDEEGNFKYFNNRFLELFGYSKEDVRNLSISSLVHPDDVAGVLAFRRRQTQKKTPSRHEFRGIRKDGSTDHFEMDVMALKKKGKILGFHSFIWDVTHRKKMEEALRESERKHRYIVENVHEGILIVQGRRRIYFNDKLLEILDCTREEYSSMPLFSYVHPDDRKRVEKRFEQQMRGKKVSRICETRFLDKNGSTKWIRINAVPITWEGSPALLFFISDISEYKRAEEEKENLQKQLIHTGKMAAIGTLTGGIAHEFNNLLQIMRGHTEFALKTQRPEDMKEAMDIVLNTSDRVSRIIQDLFVFSRRETLHKELCDIQEQVEFVLSLTEEQLKKNNVRVLKDYRKTPPVRINKTEIQQVFLNIITNAWHAMFPDGGRLEIGIRHQKGNIEVRISDSGKGIKGEHIDRIFEPFFTTKGGISKDGRLEGAGLGLSVSYGIVRRHGGTIEVESREGKGTTFTVKLPLQNILQRLRIRGK